MQIPTQGRNKKSQINLTPPMEANKPPVTDPEVVALCEPSDKEFLIIILKKFSDL